MRLLLITAAIVTATVCADAQNYGFDLYLRGGVSLPDAPDVYAQNWMLGPHTALGMEFNLSQALSIGGGLEYARNSMKKDRLLDGTSVTTMQVKGGMLDVFSLATYANYRMVGRVLSAFPFITVDAGISHFKINDQSLVSAGQTTTVRGSSETAFRMALGLGIDVPLSPTVALTCGAKYVEIFSQDQRGYVPIDAGFKFVF